MNKNNDPEENGGVMEESKMPLPSSPQPAESVSASSKSIDDEETRANYFLGCFTDVERVTDPLSAFGSEEREEAAEPGWCDDTVGIAGCDRRYCENDEDEDHPVFHVRRAKPKRKRETRNELNPMAECETVVTGNHGTPVIPSLLDDDSVIQSLRSYSFASEKHNRNRNGNGNGNRSHSLEVASETEPNDQHQAQPSKKKLPRFRDPTVVLFFKFFKFAQMERQKKSRNRPYMILGLFSNLSDIRSDLEWAQDAAYRRRAGEPYVAWSDYYAKERQGRLKRPLFVSFTLLASAVMMMWAFHKNNWKIETLQTNPLIGPSPKVLLELGALQGRALIEDGKWWLLLTPIFLHAGVIHFLLNGAFLLFVCRTIERNHGWLHTGIVFLASGMFGNAVSALIQPGYILVGASGGIYGLVGACVGDIVLNSRFFFLVLEERVHEETSKRKLRQSLEANEFQPPSNDVESRGGRNATEIIASNAVRNEDPFAIRCRRRRRVQFWCYFSLACDLLLNSMVGLLPFVDNFAHLGGLVFGFFVSLSSLRLLSASSFDYRKRRQKTSFGRWCHRLHILTLRCGGIISALFLAFAVVLFLRQSDGMVGPCPSCHYASCISLPRFWKPNDANNWWTCDGCGGVAAQVYPGLGVRSPYYATVELFCPEGNVVEVDVVDERFTTMEQINLVLPDLCKALCGGGGD